MKDSKIVWSDSSGDLRKKKENKDEEIDEKNIALHLRRLTSGKGRSIIEISALPANKSWCKKLCKELKKKLGVGGAFKNDYIEIHGEKLAEVTAYLDSREIKWKKTGG